jgi:glycosyltransferase involved in cell wall biosynthesis
MRICLIGDFSCNPDEGMKNVSNTIREKLLLKHDILALNPREIFKKTTINKIRIFQPEILHYLHGPTVRSLTILKATKYLSGNKPKTIVSATRPYFSIYSKWAVPLLKPDLLLTQSIEFERFFKESGCQFEFLPNGVDCDKFIPESATKKLNLKKQFNLPEGDKIVLHVGHIKANRNLGIFKKIQKIENFQVVIVGGTTESEDEKILWDLTSSKVRVYREYFEDISQFYKISDLYVFPVKDTGNELPKAYNQVGAIDLPLSIMEAMACNLPVITTPFGALPRLFKPGNGLYFCDTEADIYQTVKNLANKNICETRKKVLPYSWNNILKQMNKIYEKIVES